MNEIMQPTTRRNVLQRCACFVAGALGVPLVEASSRSQEAWQPQAPPPAAPTPAASTIRFYGKHVQVHAPSQKPGELPTRNGRLHSGTDLFDRPDGAKVGEFSAARFSPETPFGNPSPGHSVELQTLRLQDGTLFGIGTAGPTAGAERTHAILGGTDRFAGARGSYVIRQNPAAGKASVEFVITLLS